MHVRYNPCHVTSSHGYRSTLLHTDSGRGSAICDSLARHFISVAIFLRQHLAGKWPISCPASVRYVHVGKSMPSVPVYTKLTHCPPHVVYINRQHRCPHKPSSDIMNRSAQPCTFSEYTQQFKKYGASPRKPIKPAAQPLDRDSKMACKTINRQDYTPHPVTPRSVHPPPVYKKPEGTVSSHTEYRMTFEGKPLSQPVISFRPANGRKEYGDRFDHKSTQATDFVKFTIPERENFAVKHAYEPPKEPLETKSTIKRDFVDFGPVKPPPSLKPPQTPKLSTEPFDGKSCYRQCFTPQPIPARYQHSKEVYKPSTDTFSGNTTYTKDFPGHVGKLPALSMKPPQKKVASDSPFDGVTESRLSYRSWELPPRHSRPPTVYSPPTEAFTKHSTFRNDYPDYGHTEVTKPIRPQPRAKDSGEAAFRPVTTQRADFQSWDPSAVQRSTPIRQRGNHEPSSEKFSAVSTCRDHYRGTPGVPAASTKPVVRPVVTTQLVESDTTYRDSYVGSGFTPCPAGKLSKSVDTFVDFNFSHENPSTGHLYFTQSPPAMPTLVAEVAST